MPAMAKRRGTRQKKSIARGLVLAGAGSAVLAVPLMTAVTASAAPVAHHVAVQTATKAPAAAPKAAHGTYVVVPGDSLSKIAVDHSVRGGWHALYKINREAIGSNPSLIHPGLKLSLTWKNVTWKGAAHTTRHHVAPSAAPVKRTIAAAPVAKTIAAAPVAKVTAAPVAAKTYTNNLDGWIKQSLDVMARHDIPGTYNGIYRNVIRESSGNPNAINLWDSNAAKGIPSKGLLQVIDPTFRTYHVSGTSFNSYDPVANITAACNYAAHVYGSIDNVNGPY